MTLSKVVEHIVLRRPRFLGVPMYQGSRETALTLCREVKQLLPDTVIVGGGPLMTTFYDDLLRDPAIDIGVIGEGEVTLEELVRAGPGADPRNIPGLAFRTNDSPGSVMRSADRAPIESLDGLPYLDYGLIDQRPYYAFHERLNMPRWLFLSSSRGCPFACVFCATPVLWPGKMRRLSVERLMDEIHYQRKLDPGIGIGFMDDSFFSDKPWLNRFFKAVAREKIRYCCIGRADHLEPADVENLARTGCHYVALGVETGNQIRQKTIRKYLDLSKVRRTVQALSRHKIICKCFFILGFPDETPQEMVETVNFAVDLKRDGMDECNIFPLSLYPGTELAKGYDRSGFRSDIYKGFDRGNRPIEELSKDEDHGEKRLSIYSSVPSADLNSWLGHEALLALVKLAYNKVEKKEYLTLEELRAATGRG
ncbi:MAG: B12-binding domain-containing radical SAM protein [Candidatus Riflebacteria bacterium]|nr:B12-binding domain-containing radical SAM protein [Candidatus Riflebacteria bacterium]